MSVQAQFSKYSSSYESYNYIQKLACIELLSRIKNRSFYTVLELGCGSGQFYKLVDFPYEKYYAVDFSEQMCTLHPRHENLEVFCLDFDSNEFHRFLAQRKFDLVVAPSSLQWSCNLDLLMKKLQLVTNNIALSLFTNMTFKKLHDIVAIQSPIQSAEYYIKIITAYFRCEYEIKRYKLEFESKKEMFDYIKKSGISGGATLLSYKDAKKLYLEYDLNYLEFEILFITSFSKL